METEAVGEDILQRAGSDREALEMEVDFPASGILESDMVAVVKGKRVGPPYYDSISGAL
jgi:hypothetical protein